MLFLLQLQNPDDKIYTSDKGNKAKFFLKVVNSKSVWYMLHFLMDVLTILVDVSKLFQEKTATISRILVNIEVAVEQITKLKTRFDDFALMSLHKLIHIFNIWFNRAKMINLNWVFLVIFLSGRFHTIKKYFHTIV